MVWRGLKGADISFKELLDQDIAENTDYWTLSVELLNDDETSLTPQGYLAKGVKREVNDIMLSRYACYLIIQNGDPKKEVVAWGQTYFLMKNKG